MNLDVALEGIALGEASLEEGAKAVRELLQGEPDQKAAQRICHAFTSWTWKTIDARRRDDELAGWMELMNLVAAELEEINQDLSIKVEGFSELIQVSLTLGRTTANNPLPRGKHVKSILLHLMHAGGPVPRRQLLQGLGLKQQNMSNIMAPLLDRGLVQRQEDGREVTYELTRAGELHASRLTRQTGWRDHLAQYVPASEVTIVQQTPAKCDYMIVLKNKQISYGLLRQDAEEHRYPHAHSSFLKPGTIAPDDSGGYGMRSRRNDPLLARG